MSKYQVGDLVETTAWGTGKITRIEGCSYGISPHYFIGKNGSFHEEDIVGLVTSPDNAEVQYDYRILIPGRRSVAIHPDSAQEVFQAWVQDNPDIQLQRSPHSEWETISKEQ